MRLGIRRGLYQTHRGIARDARVGRTLVKSTRPPPPVVLPPRPSFARTWRRRWRRGSPSAHSCLRAMPSPSAGRVAISGFRGAGSQVLENPVTDHPRGPIHVPKDMIASPKGEARRQRRRQVGAQRPRGGRTTGGVGDSVGAVGRDKQCAEGASGVGYYLGPTDSPPGGC